MTYTRRQFTRVEYVLPLNATQADIIATSQAIHAEAQDKPVTFETATERLAFYFDLPDTEGGA
jgi:hypothetical protein